MLQFFVLWLCCISLLDTECQAWFLPVMNLVLTWLVMTVMAASSDADRVYGAPLLPGTVKVEEGRFKTSRSYDDTVDFYEKLFKGSQTVRMRKIINSPQVKATHVLNGAPGSGWQGINIYEKDGETRLYFIKADVKKKLR